MKVETKSETGTYMPDLPLTETSIPFPEDVCIKEAEEDASDCQPWKEPLKWSTETRNLATPWGVEQGLRRRCSSHRPRREGGTMAEGSVKQSLFL